MESPLKENQVTLLGAWPEAGLQGVQVGTLVTADATHGLWVSCPGLSNDGPRAARSTIPVAHTDVGCEVVLAFEKGDPMCPIIIGLMQKSPVIQGTGEEAVVEGEVEQVWVDDKRLRIEAKKEITLQCGESSITLRSNGKVVIKGNEIISRARTVNKVKGATVRIN